MELKDRLKQSRKRAGKTQAEVAEAVKMSQPAYQALESGRNLKSSFLPMIANFLNVDPLWLTTGSESTPEKSNADMAAMEVGIYQSGDPVPDGYVAIDYYDDVFVSAGNGYLNLEKPSNNKMLFPVDLIKE